MCEDSAFVLFSRSGQRHLDDIDLIEILDGHIRLTDLKGKQTKVTGSVRLIDLVNRRIELVEGGK